MTSSEEEEDMVLGVTSSSVLASCSPMSCGGSEALDAAGKEMYLDGSWVRLEA